jgi:hypothetical protein
MLVMGEVGVLPFLKMTENYHPSDTPYDPILA